MKQNSMLILVVVQSMIIFILLMILVLQRDHDALVDNATVAPGNHDWMVDSLRKVVKDLQEEKVPLPFLDDGQINDLRKMGLTDPVGDLRRDLMSKSQLIHQKGAVGGTMNFYFPDAIHILNRNWAMAYFEDGHYAGAILLKFRVSHGKIDWQVLDEIRF